MHCKMSQSYNTSTDCTKIWKLLCTSLIHKMQCDINCENSQNVPNTVTNCVVFHILYYIEYHGQVDKSKDDGKPLMLRIVCNTAITLSNFAIWHDQVEWMLTHSLNTIDLLFPKEELLASYKQQKVNTWQVMEGVNAWLSIHHHH